MFKVTRPGILSNKVHAIKLAQLRKLGEIFSETFVATQKIKIGYKRYHNQMWTDHPQIDLTI